MKAYWITESIIRGKWALYLPSGRTFILSIDNIRAVVKIARSHGYRRDMGPMIVKGADGKSYTVKC